MAGGPYFPLNELAEPGGLPLGDLFDDVLEHVWITSPGYDEVTGEGTIGAFIDAPISVGVPGMPSLELRISSQGAGVELDVRARFTPVPKISVKLPLILRVDAAVLRPLKSGTSEPDVSKSHLEITLGTVEVSFDTDGNLDVEMGGASLPRCMVGSTGVIVGASTIRWITPATDLTSIPSAQVPPGFNGLYLDDVDVEIPGVPGTLKMDDVFLGTGGFSGKVQQSGLTLTWDGSDFDGDIHGELFGFKGGITGAQLEFKQSALVGASLRGDVFVPYLDKRIGLDLGLSGGGALTAAAGMPVSTPTEPGVTAGGTGYLLHLEVGDFMDIDLDTLRFERPIEGPPLVELSGRIAVVVDGFDCPPLDLKGLRIDADGGVTIEGGWIDLPTGRDAPFHGFPLQLTKIGFGSTEDGRRWLGLNGGLKLADGLPLGASVEGLRISWDPDAADIAGSLQVTLDGVGLELSVPGAFAFTGAVSFFSETLQSGTAVNGFRGNGSLDLPALQMGIDANIVVGRTQNDDTFFYFYLGIDLPVGIPLFSTGAAIYGFQGLVASSMRPDRRADEPWYYGWYLREPKGATDGRKWTVDVGAFALGVGATIGTAADDGFSMSTKTLLILVLPGPQLLLEGKGQFVSKRPSSSDVASEGTFEALLALDIPAKLFQANLAATYRVPYLLSLQGGADVGYSWAMPRPIHFWHVYLGEEAMERRWQAQLLEIFDANSYLMIEQPGIDLGAWIGVDEDWTFGPVKVWLQAAIDGNGKVSWAPEHFEGTLKLSGEAGVSAFGASVILEALAQVNARGPTPWWVRFEVEASIEVDFWLWTFEWSAEFEFEWGDANTPVPQPALPTVERLAFEHLKVDEAGDLAAATVPADVRPVVIFKRPVGDLGSVGTPGVPKTATETVGPREFSYQLGHILLVRTTGAHQLLYAAGELRVSGGTISLPGVGALPTVAGGRLELGNGSSFDVTGGGTGTLTVSGSVPNGEHSYRLYGPRLRASVQIQSALSIGTGMAEAALAASPGAADSFAGGQLEVGTKTWDVVANSGSKVTIRTGSAAMPGSGAATLLGPAAPRLEGTWQRVDASPVPTKLMLGARSPYAWFRRSDQKTVEGFDLQNPSYACGPEIAEEQVCVDFDDVPLGPKQAKFTAELLSAQPTGQVHCVSSVKAPNDRYLKIGETAAGTGSTGSVRFSFDPPVEHVWVHCTTRETGTVVASGPGGDVATEAIFPGSKMIEVAGDIDQIDVAGTWVELRAICFVPGWTCAGFAAASFPQNSTGRKTYAGLTLETAGRMTVSGDVLEVDAPPKRTSKGIKQVARKADSVARSMLSLPFAARALRSRFGSPAAESVGSATVMASIEVEGIDEELFGVLPGLGPTRLQPAWSGGEGATAIVSGVMPPPPGLGDMPVLPPLAPAVPPIPPPSERPPPRPAGLDVLPGFVLREQLLENALKAGFVVGRFERIDVKPDGGTSRAPAAVASLTVYFPEPATRVRVRLVDGATVSAHGGTTQFATASGLAGEEVVLRAASGYIDRIVLVAPGRIRIRRICTDAGEFGWKRFEQWEWRKSVRRSLEAFYREDPVLRPGTYRLDVVTAWDDVKESAAADWQTSSASFTVGPPPGLGSGGGDRYPGGGPLNELATYVERTLPGPGERPFYRGYDVGVAFNENYVSRLFLQTGKALTVAVVDSNDADRRSGGPNYWDRAVDVQLSSEETEWVRTLHGDGTDRCAELDLSKVVRDEGVTVPGALLGPEELHAGELRAAGKRLFRFEFATSRYAGFAHQVGDFDGACRLLPPPAKKQSQAAVGVPVATARTNVAGARATAVAAAAPVNGGSPTTTQLDEHKAALAQLALRRAELAQAEKDAFETLWKEYALPVQRSLPRRLEIARARDALLVESPEPMHWDRVAAPLTRATSIPLVKRTITFANSFGAPDAGNFRYAGLEWQTSAELRVVDGAVERRVAGTLQLSVATSDARSAQAAVRVATGGNVKLTGTGTGVGPDITQGPTAGATTKLTLSATALNSLKLDGSGFSLVSLELVEPFRPTPPDGDLRLVAARLPASVSDTSHRVDVLAYGDTDLTGWSIRWRDALAPGPSAQYHAFQANAVLKDAKSARVFGGLAAGPAPAGFDAHFGGTLGQLPLGGVVFELLNPAGKVVSDLAALSASAYSDVTGFVAIPNEDHTRAFLLSPTGSLLPGHWRLGLLFERDAGPDLAVLSVGGSKAAEETAITFTVE